MGIHVFVSLRICFWRHCVLFSPVVLSVNSSDKNLNVLFLSFFSFSFFISFFLSFIVLCVSNQFQLSVMSVSKAKKKICYFIILHLSWIYMILFVFLSVFSGLVYLLSFCLFVRLIILFKTFVFLSSLSDFCNLTFSNQLSLMVAAVLFMLLFVVWNFYALSLLFPFFSFSFSSPRSFVRYQTIIFNVEILYQLVLYVFH